MKHYLKIWALLMLFIHLSTLAAITLVTAEGGSMTFKKVCLRKDGKAKVVATDTYTFRSLSLQKDHTQVPESETEIRICSVKLLATAASYAAVFTAPSFLYQEPPFLHQDYFSITTPADPDPPQVG